MAGKWPPVLLGVIDGPHEATAHGRERWPYVASSEWSSMDQGESSSSPALRSGGSYLKLGVHVRNIQLIRREYGWRLLGHLGAFHGCHRGDFDFPLFGRPLEKLLEVAVADPSRFGSKALDLNGNVGFDMLPGQSTNIRRHAVLGQEVPKSAQCVGIALNGFGRLVGGRRKRSKLLRSVPMSSPTLEMVVLISLCPLALFRCHPSQPSGPWRQRQPPRTICCSSGLPLVQDRGVSHTSS